MEGGMIRSAFIRRHRLALAQVTPYTAAALDEAFERGLAAIDRLSELTDLGPVTRIRALDYRHDGDALFEEALEQLRSAPMMLVPYFAWRAAEHLGACANG